MTELIRGLLDLQIPLPDQVANTRANCFNAVCLYSGDSAKPEFVGPEKFVTFMQIYYRQIKPSAPIEPGDVTIIWSRSSLNFSPGEIILDHLRKEMKGYPFGLVIEHAFTELYDGMAFQKRDPTAQGPYEILDRKAALEPYVGLPGFEMTKHRRAAGL